MKRMVFLIVALAVVTAPLSSALARHRGHHLRHGHHYEKWRSGFRVYYLVHGQYGWVVNYGPCTVTYKNVTTGQSTTIGLCQ